MKKIYNKLIINRNTIIRLCESWRKKKTSEIDFRNISKLNILFEHLEILKYSIPLFINLFNFFFLFLKMNIYIYIKNK